MVASGLLRVTPVGDGIFVFSEGAGRRCFGIGGAAAALGAARSVNFTWVSPVLSPSGVAGSSRGLPYRHSGPLRPPLPMSSQKAYDKGK